MLFVLLIITNEICCCDGGLSSAHIRCCAMISYYFDKYLLSSCAVIVCADMSSQMYAANSQRNTRTFTAYVIVSECVWELLDVCCWRHNFNNKRICKKLVVYDVCVRMCGCVVLDNATLAWSHTTINSYRRLNFNVVCENPATVSICSVGDNSQLYSSSS